MAALLSLDVDSVDPGAAPRVYDNLLYARVIVRAKGEAIRQTLKRKERILVPASVEPNPDLHKFARLILSGQLLEIVEDVIAHQPSASKKLLFAGGFSDGDKAKAFARIEVILTAFGDAYTDQRDLTLQAISRFELLVKECVESQIEMRTFHDAVWVPWVRKLQRAFNDSREVVGAPTPQLEVADLSDDSTKKFNV